MSSTEAPAEVTLSCPDCEETVTGPQKGPNSAPFRLAGHRVRAHGYRNPDAKSKGPRQRGVESVPTAVIRSIGEAAKPTSGRKVTAPPTEGDLSRGLGRGVQILTIVAASYAAETDESLRTEEARDQLVRELSLSPGAATDVMDPIAHALAPTSLNKRYGRQVIDNIDALASVGELVKLGFRWRRYFRIREAAAAAAAGQGQYMAPGESGARAGFADPPRVQADAPAPAQQSEPAAPPAPAPPPAAAAPGPAIPDVGAQAYRIDGTPMAPMQGRLMTPETLRALRNGQ